MYVHIIKTDKQDMVGDVTKTKYWSAIIRSKD